jgi:hypothetical protein
MNGLFTDWSGANQAQAKDLIAQVDIKIKVAGEKGV